MYPAGALESMVRWNRVGAALAARVRVPEVFAESPEGTQILEDFGVRPLSRVWTEAPHERHRWLECAARCAAKIAGTHDPGVNAPFTAEFFRAELEKSKIAFFSELAGEPLSPEEEAVHDAFAKSLSEEIAAHPTAFLHRDFHLDNLFEAGAELGVLDFQDARAGPDSYDIASLAFERGALVDPDPGVSEAARRVFERDRGPAEGFADRLRRVSLQRGWKAAGTFARVCAAGRGEAYRPFLAAQTSRVLRLLRSHGEELEFSKILRRRSVKLFPQEEVAC